VSMGDVLAFRRRLALGVILAAQDASPFFCSFYFLRISVPPLASLRPFVVQATNGLRTYHELFPLLFSICTICAQLQILFELPFFCDRPSYSTHLNVFPLFFTVSVNDLFLSRHPPPPMSLASEGSSSLIPPLDTLFSRDAFFL